MSIRPITIHGEPVLHRRAAEVSVVDEEIRTLVEDMYETMDAAHGVGLAAPQVGVGLRLFTYTYPPAGPGLPARGVFINPRLRLIGRVSQEEPDRDEESEGCLSVPGYGFPLKRSHHVEISGLDADGEPVSFEATGWFARILQHEYDHLDGRLYVDRLNSRWSRRWKKALKREGWTVPGHTWTPGVDRDPFGHDDPDEPDEAEDEPRAAQDDGAPESLAPRGADVGPREAD